MRRKYIYENGDAPYLMDVPPELKAAIDKVLDGPYIYDLVGKVGLRPKSVGYFLYAQAVRLVLMTERRIGVKRLYESVGKLFGKSMEAARRCMGYAKHGFRYELCAEYIFDRTSVSPKAFEYLSVMEFVALLAADVVEEALRIVQAGERVHVE